MHQVFRFEIGLLGFFKVQYLVVSVEFQCVIRGILYQVGRELYVQVNYHKLLIFHFLLKCFAVLFYSLLSCK